MYDRRLVDVERITSSLNGKFESLESHVSQITQHLVRMEDRLVASTNKPVNFAAWVTVVLVGVGMWGASIGVTLTFIDLSNEPLERELSSLQKTDDEARRKSQKFRESTNYELGYMKGQMEMLREKVEGIDSYGSRKWVETLNE